MRSARLVVQFMHQHAPPRGSGLWLHRDDVGLVVRRMCRASCMHPTHLLQVCTCPGSTRLNHQRSDEHDWVSEKCTSEDGVCGCGRPSEKARRFRKSTGRIRRRCNSRPIIAPAWTSQSQTRTPFSQALTALMKTQRRGLSCGRFDSTEGSRTAGLSRDMAHRSEM
ncbi:hypothetical protein MRB53_041388 [Persea americana]|nr:hypothetical protein MRB53_041388 [Persea americana]